MCASPMSNEKWSLTERRITIFVDGQEKEVPALDEYWIEKRPMAKYYPFPSDKGSLTTSKYDVLVDEWIKDTTVFNEDLLWLLQLEHHRFWSQVIYDSNGIQSVLSFLQEATPCYNPIGSVSSQESVLKLYGSVMKNVVTIVCRLVTAKESDVDWITKESLGDLLYSNYLVSIPMIFDLCVALGPENHVVLNKIITQMIKIQPKYQNDLLNGLEYIQASVRSVEDQAQTMIQKEIDGNLPDSHGLEMLSLYTLDCVVTLSVLLEAYPEAKEMSNNVGMALTLTQFYENSIPLLYKMVCENDKNETTLKYLSLIRLEILNTFHGIANYYLEHLLNLPAGQASSDISEKIISLFEESLDDSTFVIDYQKIFPVENDLDVIRQANNNLNALRLDYVQVGYRDAHLNQEKARNEDENEPEMINGDLSEPEVDETGACGPFSEPSETILSDEDTKIRQILDVFPDYGDGFIRKVLLRYDMNPELVIAAILEGNLPPDLANMDTSEPYIPPEESQFFEETGIKRLNIYDGDEFDVLANNNATAMKGIYKKGVGEPKKWEALLNDKTHIQENKEKYSGLGYVEDNEYDDEYDDSYDAMAETEAKSVRYKPASNVVMDEESDESSDENTQETTEMSNNAPDNSRDKRMDFCENPEVVRARYEQARQRKYGNRNPTGQKTRDVVGKPKGQGQDDETTRNRQKKGVNKSVAGNHNRKRGADFKRSKGMF